MRSVNRSIRYPSPLFDLLSKRAEEAGYKNVNEYIVGLVRYDLLTRKPHNATAGISELSGPEQDKIDDEIARVFETGESLNGSWFEHKLEEAVKAVAEGKQPEEHKLVKEVLNRIGRKR